MNRIFRKYCTEVQHEFVPHSVVKILRNGKETEKSMKQDKVPEHNKNDHPESAEYRENEMKIQMLSKNLYKQIFGSINKNDPDPQIIKSCLYNLQKHGIKVGENSKLDDVKLTLPNLQGKTIEEHFFNIAKNQCEPYQKLICDLLDDTPAMPTEWIYKAGWTCYDTNGPRSVEFPLDSSLVFDVEVCMSAGKGPTLACAVGKTCWYSWTSPKLIESAQPLDTHKYYLDDMIPLGKITPKLIIGHNVSFDRAKIREQYLIEDTGARFLDTMSLHVCVSGVTSYQRAMLKSSKEMDQEDIVWSSQSSLNSLAEVYKLYCKAELSKEPRNIFVSGNLVDIQNDFQNLMTYCANDVLSTQKVLKVLYPMFKERFPHPATLAGMLEIGSAYLPVNTNWNRYIEESNLSYEDLDIEAKYLLSKRADEACKLMHNEQYKKDLWMWDEDWSVQEFKINKSAKKPNKPKVVDENRSELAESNDDDEQYNYLKKKFQYLYEFEKYLPARRPVLPGYPAWYRKLCSNPKIEDWIPGPNDIGTGMQIAPKLLSLCWEGYPLHYDKEHGWGFLIPFQAQRPDSVEGKIPLVELVKKCPVIETETEASEVESEYAMKTLWKDVESNITKKDYYSRKPKKDRTSGKYSGTGIWCNTIKENCCWFMKLPHKNGPSNRVGNPLARDFLNKFSENVLSGDGETSAERVIQIARMLSYWRNNRDRITNQLVTWIDKNHLPKHLKSSEMDFGAIIPQVVVCGTLTRRAMEPTWTTASNAQTERIGSELRAMVQAPPGYKIVGADVDSQELWIASVLGDAHETGMHGATPLGWMTLSGTKSNGTDMHSITATAVGISRDHAKVMNYARIYGAGQNFAERLLKQFNPTISDSEAKSKAIKMFALTKGKKWYYLLPEYQKDFEHTGYSSYGALRVSGMLNKPVSELFTKPRWQNGTESAMFNRLEEIAGSPQPVTPFLQCRLSRALEPNINEDRFLPTRVNWVVQSGAVDFLHLMLVSMRWLMGPNIRFCLSFHDEVRYLVKDNMAYKAALAMHVTNLLTRSYCSSRIGLHDLPQSIAFFSSVEVDTVLRKESSADCKTPSNTHGLEAGYGIPKGKSLDIYECIKEVGSDMSTWEWHSKKPKKILNQIS